MQCRTERTLSGPPMPAMMSAAVASKPVRPSVRAPSVVPASTSVLAAPVGAASSSSPLSVAVAMAVPASVLPVVTVRSARWVIVLVRTTMAVVALPAARTASRSIVPRDCPALTVSPTLTFRSKGAPSSSTVSTPRCSRTSRPDSFLKPMACPVPATMVTVASTGETMAPSSTGSTPSPSPTALEEKTGSGTSARSMTVPVTGETMGISGPLSGSDMGVPFGARVGTAVSGRAGSAVLRGGRGGQK